MGITDEASGEFRPVALEWRFHRPKARRAAAIGDTATSPKNRGIGARTQRLCRPAVKQRAESFRTKMCGSPKTRFSNFLTQRFLMLLGHKRDSKQTPLCIDLDSPTNHCSLPWIGAPNAPAASTWFATGRSAGMPHLNGFDSR